MLRPNIKSILGSWMGSWREKGGAGAVVMNFLPRGITLGDKELALQNGFLVLHSHHICSAGVLSLLFVLCFRVNGGEHRTVT